MAKASRHDRMGSAPKQSRRKGEGFNEKTGLYYFYYYDENGKRKQVTCKTLEGLREKKTNIDNLLANRVKTTAKEKTLNNVYEEWISLKRGLVGHTKANYMWVYEHYCQPKKLGKMKVQDLTKGIIRNHYNQLREQDHLAISTIDGLQTVINQVLGYAVEERYISSNPAIGCMTEMKRQAPIKQSHPALTKEEQDRFLSFIEKHEIYSHWYPMFKVFIGTGMRVGELSGLRWEDVDTETKTIDINHTLLYYSDKEAGGCRFLIGKPKTKAGYRKVVMLEGVKQAFIQQKQMLEERGLKCKISVEGTPDVPEAFYSNFVFLSKDGGCLHQGTINKTIKRIIRDANVEAMDKGLTMLPPFSCHTFRSSYITRCAEKYVPVEITMKQVGHDDKKTTLKIYTTVHPDWQRRELAAIEDLFE